MKNKDTNLWKCGTTKAPVLLTETLKNYSCFTLTISYKVNIYLIYFGAAILPLRNVPNRNVTLCPHKNLYGNVRRGFISYSKEPEINRSILSEQLYKLWYRYTMQYNSAPPKTCTSDTVNLNMMLSQKGRLWHILYNSISMKLETMNLISDEQKQTLASQSQRRRRLAIDSDCVQGNFSWGKENVQHLDHHSVYRHTHMFKTHQNVDAQRVTPVCKLYLNKVC